MRGGALWARAMPTIAEVIAAKKAAAAKAAGATATHAEQADPELDGLIDRLKPVGKPKAAALVLSASTTPPPAKTPEEPAPRSLGSSDGEAIDVTPLAADPAIKNWHKAVNAFATELVVMRDPHDSERCWLAVRLEDEPLHPLLLKDLPLYEHPMTQRKPGEPF